MFLKGAPPPVYPALDPEAMMEMREDNIALMFCHPDTGIDYEKLVSLTPAQARFIGTMLQGLASEAEVQIGYQTALRSHKHDEQEIMTIMTDAANVIVAMRELA
jgi:hypothetical protein